MKGIKWEMKERKKTRLYEDYYNSRVKDFNSIEVKDDPKIISDFCIDVLRFKRWKEKEEIIRTDAISACMYAVNILKRRWVEAENKISENKKWAIVYVKEFFQGHFPEDEVETNPLFDAWHEMMLKKIFSNSDENFNGFEAAMEFATEELRKTIDKDIMDALINGKLS